MQDKHTASKDSQKEPQTSWQNSSSWYTKIVGEKGHYYHQNVIIPNALKMLNLKPADSVLDLACGQGVLARNLTDKIGYVGLDASQDLLDQAKVLDKNPNHMFIKADLAKKLDVTQLNLTPKKFSHAVCILAIQNIEDSKTLFANAHSYLEPAGKFLLVMNHPAFRVPQHSNWYFDEATQTQYRTVSKYMSDTKIDILMEPSKGTASKKTFSYHHPLQTYFTVLTETGFVVQGLQEWVSTKQSEGKRAEAENAARNEIPMFLALLAHKI